MSEEVCGRCIYLESCTQQQYADLHCLLQESSKEDSEATTEYSEAAVFALSQKLKLMHFMQGELAQLNTLLGEGRRSARDLESSAKETFAQLQRYVEEQEEACTVLRSDITGLEKLLDEEENNISAVEDLIFGTDEQHLALESAVEDAQEKLNDIEDVKERVTQAQNDLTEVESRRFSLFEEVLASSKRFAEEATQLSDSARAAERNNEALCVQISEAKSQLEVQRKTQYQSMRLRQQKKGLLTTLRTLYTLAEDEQKHHTNYQTIATRYEGMASELREDLENSLTNYSELSTMLAQQDTLIKDSTQDLHRQITRVVNRINVQESLIADLQEENAQLNERGEKYQGVLAVPVEYSFDNAGEEFIAQAAKKLLVMSDLFLLQAYRIKLANRSVVHLQELISRTEGEVLATEKQAVETQALQQVYIVDCEDPLDSAVQRVVNSLGFPLKRGLVKVPRGYMHGERLLELELNNEEVYVKGEGRSLPLAEYLV